MDYTQNEKIAQVTEKTLIVGVDIGGENHYARAFNWRGQELSKKAFRFSDDILGYQVNIPARNTPRIRKDRNRKSGGWKLSIRSIGNLDSGYLETCLL